MEAVSQLPALESLTLLGRRYPMRSFACLQHMASLRSLSLEANLPDDEEHWKPLLDSCRLLTQLRSFSCGPLQASDLLYLLRPPHQLQLQGIGCFYELDDAIAAALPLLPTLQYLDLSGSTCSNFAFVGQLPELRQLDIRLHDMPAATRAALLDSATAGHFSRITKLVLRLEESDGLTALLAGMPQLSTLHLYYWQLRLLRFLATPQLQASLTALSLAGIENITLPLSELEHVYGLKQLCKLVLVSSFDAPLPVDVQRQLQPGRCLQLPLLERFFMC